MTTALQSVEDLRDTIRHSIQDLESENRVCPDVVWSGTVISTWGAMRAALESATADHCRAMIRALNLSDGQKARRVEREEQWREQDERRELAGSEMTAEEFEETNRDLIESARHAAAREATPMSQAQADEMLGLLRTIAASLDKK